MIVLLVLAISMLTLGAAGQDEGTEIPYPPNAVTGHTVHATYTIQSMDAGEGFPVRFPTEPVDRKQFGGRGPVERQTATGSVEMTRNQAECVAWTNGKNLDSRPAEESFGDPQRNSFFSDEDEVGSYGDLAAQDYDPGRYLAGCVPTIEFPLLKMPKGRPTDFAGVTGHFAIQTDPITYGTYAVVVERGDCDPATGADFRFRGHLDFVDPNNMYHEVQEYDYTCGAIAATGGPGGNLLPTASSDAVRMLFPDSLTDPSNEFGCIIHATPADNADPQNGTAGHFDLGHKCNGSIQDLFTERLWITPIHEPTFDETTRESYTFALVIDTCSGRNVDEGWDLLMDDHSWDGLDYTLDGLGFSQPLTDVCHDGSSFSFDDTPRGRTTHDGPPATEEEIMRGNAFDLGRHSETFGMHRQNCRLNYVDWPYNDYPGKNDAQLFGLIPGSEEPRNQIGADCYPEDHKTAQIEIYVFDTDPTDLFAANSNGLTGVNSYVAVQTTGPDYVP